MPAPTPDPVNARQAHADHPRPSVVVAMTLVALTVLFATPRSTAAQQCTSDNTVTADVVALDQPIFYNRLGAFDPVGMIFALLEAVIALAVVGLAVVGATEAASRTLRTQQDISRRAEAVALAEAALDETALLGPDSLERRRNVTVEVVRLDAGSYRVSTLARRASASDELWRVQARVTWSDGQLDLETLIYRPGRSPLARADP